MKKAFTLIEMLIVMAIMGILTAITVGQFQTAKKKANDTARKGDLNSVAKALQMYFTDYGRLPDANATGQIVMNGVAIPWGGEFKDSAGYIYMKQLPVENKVGVPQYCYKTNASNKAYALFANLENGMDSQCDRDKNGTPDVTYDCGGNTNAYCFAYYSPNISLDNDGNFL